MNLLIKSDDELKDIINNYKKNNEEKFNMVFSEMEYSDIIKKLELDIVDDFISVKEKGDSDWDNDSYWDLVFDFSSAYIEIGDTIERLIDSYIDNEARDMKVRKKIYSEYLLQIIPFAYKNSSWGQTALTYKHTLKHALELNKIIQEL